MIYNEYRLTEMIAQILKCKESELNDESGLTRTFNWDSLNHVMILTSIEDLFGIKINDEMFPQLTTIVKIKDYLKSYKVTTCIDSGACNCCAPCFHEEKVHFYSKDGLKLIGIYNHTTKPIKGFVILTHGIPAEKDEGGFHKNMAAYLAQLGYDSFRFDFRYMGESESGFQSKLTITDLISDIECAYQTAISLGKNQGKIFLNNQYAIGTSCGGGILLKWINDFAHKESIKKLFLCCPVLDYVYESTGIFKDVITNKMIDDIITKIEKVGFIEGRDAEYGKQFLLDSLCFDAQKELELYGNMVEIYHGTADQCVPFEISEKFATLNKNVDLIVINKARHGFGGPYEEDDGTPIDKTERKNRKRKCQAEVIYSIACSIRSMEKCLY